MNARSKILLAIVLTSLSAGLPARSWAQGPGALPASKPVPLPPLAHPPGDIPDTQVFVDYRSPLGFAVKVPEGWARRDAQDRVSFTSAYDGASVQLGRAAVAPSPESVKRNQAAALESSPAAVRITKIVALQLPAGQAVLISFSSNSEPNAVTGKAIRLENEQYLFWKDGRLATLTLWAPFGADNADQWQLMARSFRWQ
ncbi:MAG: hypothetical protein M0015_05090 [Betaproteobacteria bacterium]|nr:hypothetical protein [Betaproteobacteria bacterium]